jgi:hypothetical protein
MTRPRTRRRLDRRNAEAAINRGLFRPRPSADGSLLVGSADELPAIGYPGIKCRGYYDQSAGLMLQVLHNLALKLAECFDGKRHSAAEALLRHVGQALEVKLAGAEHGNLIDLEEA